MTLKPFCSGVLILCFLPFLKLEEVLEQTLRSQRFNQLQWSMRFWHWQQFDLKFDNSVNFTSAGNSNRRTSTTFQLSTINCEKQFASFKRKCKKRKTSDKPLWNHIFVCLSSTNWKHVPTFAEKAELALSGIGEKKISSPPPYETFEETMYREFPNLREGGGFEVLRRSGKLLQSIPIPSGGYSVDYLKSVLAQAKCYVRPLQMDLILNREEVCVYLS